MGVRLIVEVLDYAPDTLTPRERYVLVVFAETARDSTRTCWPGVEKDETFVRRCRLSRTQRYDVIKTLIAKGALELVKRGNRGSRAAYRVAEMAPAEAVLPDPQEPSDDEETPESVPETGTQSEDGKGPGNRDKGSRKPGQRVPETGTPSPQSPQESPQSVPAREDIATAAVEELHAQTGQTVTPEWGTRVAEHLLADASGPVDREVAYVRTAIRTRTTQGRGVELLPTPSPPRLEEIEEPPPLPAPEPPAETAPCGHGWPADDAENCFLCIQKNAAEPSDGPRPSLTVHQGHNRPNGRHSPVQAPLLTTVPDTEEEDLTGPALTRAAFRDALNRTATGTGPGEAQ